MGFGSVLVAAAAWSLLGCQAATGSGAANGYLSIEEGGTVVINLAPSADTGGGVLTLTNPDETATVTLTALDAHFAALGIAAGGHNRAAITVRSDGAAQVLLFDQQGRKSVRLVATEEDGGTLSLYPPGGGAPLVIDAAGVHPGEGGQK